MGLGRGPLSIMDQLVEKGVVGDSFSLCYGGMAIGGGAMVLGELSPPPDMVFSPSNPARSQYYNIELTEIHASGKPLRIKPEVFDSKHGTVLDSGTTYAYLPDEAFSAFKDAIVSSLELKQVPGPDPHFNDICFSGAGSEVTELSKVFPEVDMVFGNGQKLPLSPENYLFRHSKIHDAYCLGVFPGGRDLTTLLGGIVVRNTLVTYDRQKERIGFWKTNCSELWERLQIHEVSAPAPSTSHNGETTTEISPAPSPNALQNYILSGQFEVGLITFDMSLSVKYPDLKPRISELAELIAHELEIDANQVHLMNFTSIDDGTLIRCVILPSGSDFISNPTAEGIISRLTEHRVQLPENFGNYKLIEWNVEPPSRRSWWHRHLLGVLLGIVMLAFSTLAVWYFWRWKYGECGVYRHVDAATPEQELTPL
ncbi:aspartic proteinase CDR1-like [Iris pallida]|uniref:Aspartic proteinase CDR1-like n=1 Tax=Iris pallida TaxID=29817 RepID=A0AAX6G056_IRIPA|nr:aspartic proteinase CDR1-like [Iris pallida]